MIAAKSASSSSYDVRISALMLESTDADRAADLDARPVGEPAVEHRHVGASAGMRAVASTAEADSPTTSMSSLRSSRKRSPSRTTSWSSSRYTRMGSEVMELFLP